MDRSKWTNLVGGRAPDGRWLRRLVWGLVLLAVGACDQTETPPAAADPKLPDVLSGSEFLSPETRAQQKDAFANPGFLWVDRGQVLFNGREDGGKSCAACHVENGMPLRGAAARYPAIDRQSGELVNLEGRINLCRERYQGAEPFDYESEDLLSLTAYVANLSFGLPVNVSIDPEVQRYFDQGKSYFFTRRGQLNLACHQCHDQNWGRRLRGDTISQGHGNGFPAYRLEWETLGSLHRRFRDCDFGVRAEPLDYGSEVYVALELYLAARAQGLTVETPAIRR